MNNKMLCLLLACAVSMSWGAPEPRMIEPPLRYDMGTPADAPESTARTVFSSWMIMPLDHFDPQNTNTFLMRFMFNEEFFGGEGSPIFILIGGEWAIAEGWLRAGNMYEMARENRGYQIYTEHRYYGETIPFARYTTENLRFLNVDQALADLAYFIQELKKIPQFASSPVILYGGSYAANMALWFKQRYPHLAKGAVASSGPIYAKVDYTEYLEVVHEAYSLESGEECLSIIRQGIEDTVQAMNTEEGRRTIERNYRICEATPLDFDDYYTMSYFSGLITWSFSWSVQLAVPGSLRGICRNFANNTYGETPMQKIGGFIAATQGLAPDSCWSISFDSYINMYASTIPNANRAWFYQVCTEYGFFQTAPRIGTVFDPLKWMSEDFYVETCKRAYDQRFDKEFIYDAVDRVNLVFGGLSPNVNNTINIHGYIDPWRALGVYKEDLSETSPTYTVDRASHCFDMRGWAPTDTIQMTQVQQTARRIVASWLSS